MPKKHHKTTFIKPTQPVHPSLTPSQHERHRSAVTSASEQRSVNDLINHLRRTQISQSTAQASHASPVRFASSPRSVHPSLRNLLELPETPPPRPRLDARRNAVIRTPGQRPRRIAGPPPPESWLTGRGGVEHGRGTQESRFDSASFAGHSIEGGTRRTIYRLERLPGAVFPRKDALLHVVLRSMAQNWAWHVEYDGPFLRQLPNSTKTLLLSYLTTFYYAVPAEEHGQGWNALRILFGRDAHLDDVPDEMDAEILRLDCGGTIGRSMNLKQLQNELTTSASMGASSLTHIPETGDTIPESWDMEDAKEDDERYASEPQYQLEGTPFRSGDRPSRTPPPLVKQLVSGPRFENLRFLSLAHPVPAAAKWSSLLTLLSRLSTLTHLSLAHWPIPTLTPNAMTASVRSPVQRSLTFSYSGTDPYTALDNNWAEAAGVLRKLSRATYCLKWLDLEGCADWIPALMWRGTSPDGEISTSTGPEWNGSWRDIEWICLGPGWIPITDEGSEGGGASAQSSCASASPALRSLASSMHAPRNDTAEDQLPWNVELERIKYRQAKERERHLELLATAKSVADGIMQIRREGRGKWIHFAIDP